MEQVLAQASPWHFTFVDCTEKEVLRSPGGPGGQNRILVCISINQSSMVPTHFGVLGTQLSDITTARTSLSADNRGFVSWFHINAGFLPH